MWRPGLRCPGILPGRTGSSCGRRPRCTGLRRSSTHSRPSCRRSMTPLARRSIKHRTSLSGVGLHTGAATEATFVPAKAGQGVVFRRVDLRGAPEVPARLTEVEALERRTAVGKGETTIHTVEHLLAAVAVLEIDDLIIELNGPEPPIFDGSVQPYFEALGRAQPVEVGGEPVVLTV